MNLLKFRVVLPVLLLVLSILSFQNCKETGGAMTKEKKIETAVKNWTPDWAKKAVWYQIFPERFRNGDPKNDPMLENIKGSWPHDNSSPWEVHPWTSDWYKLQSYEKKNGKDIWFNIQRRRYGGDIQGIIDKLDYLLSLGVNALYLNPIFEAPSMHKYDGATYHHVDPNFGPDPEGDRELISKEIPHDPSTWVWTSADKLFLKLVEEVHARNMRIIIDGVFNHMGLNSWAFKDVEKNQEESPYKDWFKIESWEDKEAGTKFIYTGWYGVKELPELKQDKNGIVEGPKKYIFDITKRWMDPSGDGNLNKGIDGWRLDVAFMVKHNFWKDWRKLVKSVNPEGYIVAEIVDSIEVNKPYLLGDEFDAVMNYNFTFASAEYFINDKTRIKTSEFDKLLTDLRNAFPGCVNYVMQNLYGSHDTNRLLSHLVNKDLAQYRQWGDYYEKSKGANPEYSTGKPGAYELSVQKLMTIFQMTYLGAPMIYYGDEVGMWGANDPCCRKPMIWEDLKYESEICLPDQSHRANGTKIEVNKSIFEHYQRLISIRHKNPALQLGDYSTLLIDDEKQVYAFIREYDGNKVFVVLNNDAKIQAVELIMDANTKYVDLLEDETFSVDDSGKLQLDVPLKFGRILVKQ